MKFNPILSVLLAIAFLIPNISIGQQAEIISKKYKADAIESLNQLMNDFYVFPDVAKKTEQHLDKQLESGHFDEYSNIESFAEALTASVQAINKDKHMRIRKNRPYVAQENSPERLIEERIDRVNRSRRGNLGFTALEMLEGNIAYLDLRGFAGLENGKAKVDSYMKLMAEADAVIIDLSKNGGGSPDMVQYLCSFFFNQKVHLNSLYYREGDVTREYWTLDEVGGKKMPEVPLFVITSSRTFSAAEEFSYNMQTRERATLVGQTSGGGANPGGTRPINADLGVFIPTGRAINPITKTNWEGVGVIPEVKTDVDNAKEKAHELAKKAAEDYRKKSNAKMANALSSLFDELDNYIPSKSNKSILEAFAVCVENRYLEEYNINALGYTYLMEHEQAETAEAIFLSNTKLFPKSPNVFDSYGEVLMMKGDLKASVKNYKKAVEVAKSNEDPDLEMYMKNLEKAKSKMSASN
jgi:tetratricopeptide (TPR) repeat protein